MSVSGPDPQPPTSPIAAVVANLLVFGTLAYAAYLEAREPALYFLSVQEDEYMEWGTVWCFMMAAGIYAAGGLRRGNFRRSWFVLGLAVFCFLVAMEEISWGQRILGYRPPSYFLEHNFQQEFNLHNVVGTSWRKLALKAVIAGYGVVLPLAALVPSVRRLLARAAVLVPPLALTPAFLATAVIYERYPWEYTGEWVECMLGEAFLLAAILGVRGAVSRASTARVVTAVVGAWLVAAGLGVAAAAASRNQRDAHPGNVAAAELELETLRRDFLAGKLRTKCGLHKRLYTYMEEYDEPYLRAGEFSHLQSQGLPEARARFLLDPWNSPYWVYDLCSEDRGQRKIFVYSLGPNRRLDSSSREFGGDDLAAVVRER